ncbi:hypothetical protein H5410_048017 [Solanum commersonii]|uniref:Uncharacterized protein n=1 Tax=Solanum commersonii TaxID=4109 RepID=A0A9J5XJ32_SOLCO|nr:hypothetical protein H5410_048017 [Solanum commersonii]
MPARTTPFTNNGGTIKKVVVSLEPNGPEALREDNISKNEVVVLFGGKTCLGVCQFSGKSMLL